MSAYKAAHLDEIAAEKWPYWAPIRHHFDIRSFGINAWRGADGDEVIKRHTEEESGQEELYIVLSGRATFTVGGDEIDAPRARSSTSPTRAPSASLREGGRHGRALARRGAREGVRAVGLGHGRTSRARDRARLARRDARRGRRRVRGLHRGDGHDGPARELPGARGTLVLRRSATATARSSRRSSSSTRSTTCARSPATTSSRPCSSRRTTATSSTATSTVSHYEVDVHMV